MKTHLYTLAAGLLIAMGAHATDELGVTGEIHEAFPETPALDRLAKRAEPPTPVSLNMAEAFRVGVNIHELDPLTDGDFAEADRKWAKKYANVHPGPQRVGVVRAIEPDPISIRDSSALESKSEEEGKIWTLAVRSPGAYGIRLHFTDFNVGEGSAVVYADSDAGVVVRGPYSRKGPENDGDFWTASLPGDEAYIEVAGKTEPQFAITELTHFDRGASSGERGALDDGPPLLDCHLDVNCYGDTVHEVVKNATGLMLFGGGSCTGTLLTDLDGETWVPYFITARHCLSTQAEVDTLTVIWGYETDYCIDDGGTVPDQWSLPSSVGGTLLKTDAENDMTFIRLNSVPEGVTYAGFTTATSAGEYGVHHPKGSWKRVVFLEDVGACPLSCWCFDATDFDYYDRIDGLTQKGSSGSGVFTSDGKFAGQLQGVCSGYHTDGKPLTCSNIADWTNVYGEFETSWSTIGWWLIIGGTIYVDSAGTCPVPAGYSTCPYLTIEDAIEVGWPEARVKIQAGSYASPLTFDKPMTFLAMNGVVTIGG